MQRFKSRHRLLIAFILTAILSGFSLGCRAMQSSGLPFLKKDETVIEEIVTADLPVPKVKPKSEADEMSEFAAEARKHDSLAGDNKKAETEKKNWAEKGDSTFMMSSRAKEIHQRLER